MVATIEDEVSRQEKWDDILTSVHASAINLPFSGKRNPAVLNKRLAGYTPGQQQYDYPLHTLEATSGDNTIVVAPGAQTGLFSTVGRLDPHTYRPNEFFANNWVYEGLVEYGPDGTILPSLAASHLPLLAASHLSCERLTPRGNHGAATVFGRTLLLI